MYTLLKRESKSIPVTFINSPFNSLGITLTTPSVPVMTTLLKSLLIS